MNTTEIFSNFIDHTGKEIKQVGEFDPRSATLDESIEYFSRLNRIEDFERVFISLTRWRRGFSLMRGLALIAIDDLRWYERENCSSISELCHNRKQGPLKMSPGLVSREMKTARVLKDISHPRYFSSIKDYLEGPTNTTRKGFRDESRGLSRFKLSDFIEHKKKLPLLGRLLPYIDDDMDWDVFFTTKTPSDYENYVEQQIVSRKAASFRQALKNGRLDDFGLPFRIPMNSPGSIPEPVIETANDDIQAFYHRTESNFTLDIEGVQQIDDKILVAVHDRLTKNLKPHLTTTKKNAFTVADLPTGALKDRTLLKSFSLFTSDDAGEQVRSFFHQQN